MRGSVEIILRGISQSDELERYIGEQARQLGEICDCAPTCRVVAQCLRRPKEKGVQLAVGLAVTVPGTEIVVNREHAHDIRIAVREAFKAAGLQLEDHARRHGNKECRPREPGAGNTRER